MSSKSTSTPSKRSRCNSRPILQKHPKSYLNYQSNNDHRHYRNTPNNEPFRKHRRNTSFEDHLNKKADQSPSRSTSLTLSNSSSKQSYTMKEKITDKMIQ